MSESNNSLKYKVLFGGGAIRGVAYCGAYKAIEEFGITFDTLAGSSVGAVFAGLIAVGYSPEETKEIMFQVNYELFKDIQFGIGSQFALCKGEVFLDWLRELIEKKFYGKSYKKGKNKAVTFSDLEKNLVIITTDLSNFECKEFSKNTTPDFEVATAIRISSGMPGLMKPYEYNNTLLTDGDIQKSAPMWSLTKTLQTGSERTLELRLEGNFQGNEHNMVEFINALYSYATSTGTKFLTDLYGMCDDYDYIVLDTGDLNIVDFNLSEEERNALVQQGYEQTKSYLTKNLKEKKQYLLQIYNDILKNVDLFIKNIRNNKVLEAKCNLGELYMELCENINNINHSEKADLTRLKDLFNENLKEPLLFGQIKVENKMLIEAQSKLCKKNIQKRISEYEEFIGIK